MRNDKNALTPKEFTVNKSMSFILETRVEQKHVTSIRTNWEKRNPITSILI